MKNEFGKYLSNLRKEHNITQEDLAKQLGISNAFLSKLESGLKKVPNSLLIKIIEFFNLNKDQQIELYNIVDISQGKIIINLDTLNVDKRDLVLLFYNNINKLDENTLNKIYNILNKII